MKYTEAQVNTVARAIHESNRVWCLHLGDTSQRPWEEMTDEGGEKLRESSRQCANLNLSGVTPRENHENWLKERRADGWVWGPVRDEAAKTNPALVEYDDLDAGNRAKNALNAAIAAAFAAAFDALDG